MSAKTLALVMIFVTNFRLCYPRTYDNYTLLTVKATKKAQLQFLQNCSLQKYLNLIFWKNPYRLYDQIQFMLDTTELELFLNRAESFNLQPTIISDNVQREFNKQTINKYQGAMRTDTYDWKSFYSVGDIYKWLKDLSATYPQEVELETIGKSNEGRDIYAVAIRKVQGNKKVVIVEGGAHGTEWISVAFVTYLIYQLLEGENDIDTKLAQIANKYHWYLIPVLNPDGYEYNQKTDRMWRKNRRNIKGYTVGVDINRNFAYSFGKYDTSMDPKGDTYCGPGPFSEPETRALADLVLRKHSKMKYFFSVHGFGQIFIIPYSDKPKHMENYNEIENYAKQAALKMYQSTGHKYVIGTYHSTIGTKASGDSASWVKWNYKTKYVLTILLRDNGTYGHAIPPEEIIPACREAMTGLIELMTVEPKYVTTAMFNEADILKHCSVTIVLCLLLSLK